MERKIKSNISYRKFFNLKNREISFKYILISQVISVGIAGGLLSKIFQFIGLLNVSNHQKLILVSFLIMTYAISILIVPHIYILFDESIKQKIVLDSSEKHLKRLKDNIWNV